MFCQAYQCNQYVCYELNTKYCWQHYQELTILYQNSNIIVQQPKEQKCSVIDCNRMCNLVAGKWCLPHYYEEQQRVVLHYFQQKNDRERLNCDYEDCKMTSKISTIQGKWCNKHFKKIDNRTCDNKECFKTTKLIEDGGLWWCHKHYSLKYPSLKNNETCNVEKCHKRAKLLYFDGKKWCNKHFNTYYKKTDDAIIQPPINNLKTTKIEKISNDQPNLSVLTTTQSYCDIAKLNKTATFLSHKSTRNVKCKNNKLSRFLCDYHKEIIFTKLRI